MKKYIILFSMVLGLACAVDSTIPKNDSNIVGRFSEVASVNYSTITDPLPLFDTKEDTSVLVTPTKNAVVLQLAHTFYIREIKIITDTNVTRCIVKHSKTAEDWFTLTDSTFSDQDNKRTFTIRGEYALAQYLAFTFISSASATVYEVSVFPETEMRLKSYYIKDHWNITDTEAFNAIDTRLETQQTLAYSEVGVPSANQFKATPAPKLDGELISLGGLKAGSAYEYKMTVVDYNGNMLALETRQLNTRPQSYAANKKYEGTFTTHYSGATVTATENPLTDGSTDINTGLAISGAVSRADQFVIVDLGQARTISKIVLLWRALGYSLDYSLAVSTDKQSWTTVGEHLTAQVTTARTVEGHPIKAVFTEFKPITARYVRMLAAKGSAVYSKHGTGEMELFEFKVF